MIETSEQIATISEQTNQSWWLKMLPSFISEKIVHRTELLNASNSFFWLTIDTFLTMGLIFVVNLLLARSLGPDQYGYFSYLLAFFSLFLPISKLGLPSILVRNLSRDPNSRNTILGTGFILRFLAGFATLVAAILAMVVIRPQDQLSQMLIAFLGLMAIFQSFEVIEYYFQSKLLLRNITIAKICAIGISSILKLLAIFFALPLSAIISLWTIEAVLLAIAFIGTYLWSGSFSEWKFDFTLAKKLLRESTPLLLSSMVIMGYAQADQLFLNYYRGSAQLGQYAVALVILNGLALIPVVVQKALAPVLMKVDQKKRAALFNHQLQQVYRLMTIISIVVTVVLVFFGPQTITFLYGNAYAEAGHLLSLLPFRFLLVSFGVTRSLYVVSHGLFDYDLATNVAGIIISIVGSIILIPLYGVYGLLLASFISLVVSTLVMDFFHPKMRINGILALKALVTPYKFTLE